MEEVKSLRLGLQQPCLRIARGSLYKPDDGLGIGMREG
jgi:hypothetical protein